MLGLEPKRARCPKRIFIATGDSRLIALDAKRGKPISQFGDHGEVNLRTAGLYRVAKGAADLEGAGALAAGDAVRLTAAGTRQLTADAKTGVEVLIWETD